MELFSYLRRKAELCCFLLTVTFITIKVCCVVLPMKCWHGGSVAQGEASFSCSILCPIYLKCRTSANIAFLVVCHKWTSFFDKMFLLVRKRWVHKTASSTRINGSCKRAKKFSLSKWKKLRFQSFKVFCCLKKSQPKYFVDFWKVVL